MNCCDGITGLQASTPGPERVEKVLLPTLRLIFGSTHIQAKTELVITGGQRRRGARHSSQHNSTMGVPFEALLPYGICLAVCDSICLHSIALADEIGTVLRYHRCRSFQDQTHAERRQACQTLSRPVGQTKCAIVPFPNASATPNTDSSRAQ